jgi:hypothetical protein
MNLSHHNNRHKKSRSEKLPRRKGQRKLKDRKQKVRRRLKLKAKVKTKKEGGPSLVIKKKSRK